MQKIDPNQLSSTEMQSRQRRSNVGDQILSTTTNPKFSHKKNILSRSFRRRVSVRHEIGHFLIATPCRTGS